MATDEPRRPGKATEAVIYSWGIRWQCPRDTDPERHDARLRMLMQDCAAIAPGDLRKVGDRLATQLKFLPMAAEVHGEYERLLAERADKEAPADPAQGWGNRSFPRGFFASGSTEHRRWIADVNCHQQANGQQSRLVLDEGAHQSRMVMLCEGWRDCGDGTVSLMTEA